MVPTMSEHIQSITIAPSTFRESCNRENFQLADKILYDLILCAEWKKEMEQLSKHREKMEDSHSKGWGWSRFFRIPPVIPQSFQQIHDIQLPWQVALSREGKVVAVIQTHSIEIRNAHDDFNSVYAVCLAKDPWPRWRKACWTPDESSLALASTNGDIHFFDLLGHRFMTISMDVESGAVRQDAGHSWFKSWNTSQDNRSKEDGAPDWRLVVAQLLFIGSQSSQWNYELLVLSYSGSIYSYFIKLSDCTYEKHFQFSLEPHCPMGATGLDYLPRHQLLVVAAPLHPALITSSGPTSPDHLGLSLWRRLNTAPYCKLVSSLEQDVDRAIKSSYLEKVPFLMFSHSNRENCVYKLSVSPSGDLLTTVHTSGALGLWHLPSLRPMRIWTLDQQMALGLVNPNLKPKVGVEYPFHINGLKWWSDTELIISRNNGGVTVCSISDLDNRLGLSPEWLFPTPQITEGFNGSVMLLECETKVYIRNYLGLQETSPEEADECPPLHHRLLELMKVVLYYMMDNERFQPLTERPRILHRTYRMLQLKSTTPQELFYRMLNTQRYQDALALAANHGLDSDLVYQRQWRAQPVTLMTITLYLLKISKRSWALHECLERVPDNYQSTRALLLFGLSISSLEALVALGTNQESGRLIEPDTFVPETEEEMRTVSLAEKLRSLLSYQDFKLFSHLSKANFNPEQKQLIQTRQKLLLYLDRLATYEAILGSQVWKNFKADFFDRFRSQSWLEACLHFAHSGHCKAVQRMMVSRPLTHHLVVLSNFPESMPPHRYRELLPRLQPSDLSVDYSLFSSLDSPVRIKDWCEEVIISDPGFPDALQDRSEEYYAQHPSYNEFKGNPSPELYSRWYRRRAAEIYNHSHLLNNATELIEIGKEFHVQGLDSVHHLLLSLECLLYECRLDSVPETLQEYEGMDALRKMELFITNSKEETFVKDLRRWVLPFIEREKQPSLLNDFLRQFAPQQLNLCLQIFRTSQETDPIITKMEDLMRLSLECIYLSERDDQIETIFGILDCLPDRKQTQGLVSEKIDELHDRLDMLEKQLMVAEILNQHGLHFTISYLAKCQNNTGEVKKLLQELTRYFNMRDPPPMEQDWENLRIQLLSMQEELFIDCLAPQDCLQILVEGMLCSGREPDILLAKDFICQTSTQEPEDDRLHYSAAREAVLTAVREYFNSAARLHDPCMNLARTCLKLIKEEGDSEILEEEDLVSSLVLLHDLGVEVLPLQVRMCKDRLALLRQALHGKLTQKPSKVLPKLRKLARLLRICNSDCHQREALVLSLVAEASFSCKDYGGCYQICQQIIQDGHEGGWEICHRLGMEAEFTNIEARHDCLSFSAAFCRLSNLEEVLNACAQLEIQMKCKKLRLLVGDELASRLEDELGIEHHQTPEQTETSSPHKRMDRRIWRTGEKMLMSTAKSLMSSISGPHFWKEAFRWPATSESIEDIQDSNEKLQKQGLHAFYCPAVGKDFFCSQIDPDYQHYSSPDRPHQTDLYLDLYRILALKDSLDQAPLNRITSDLILNLAQQLIRQDLSLALPLLLTIKDVKELQNDFWPTLPQDSLLASQLEVYIYAAHLYAAMSGEPPLHHLSPQELLQRVEAHNPSINPELSELFHAARSKMADMADSQFLQRHGVDVTRFHQDPAYRADTILGMAMCSETYDSALSLADNCGVGSWELAAARLEFLFAEASLSPELLKQKLEQPAAILSTQPAKFRDFLRTQVWGTLSGTDLPRLKIFLQLERGLCSNTEELDSRIELVQLVAKIAPGLDVKKLLETSECSALHSLIAPHLTSDNFEHWERLVALLPGQADASVVRLLWGSRVWQSEPLPLTNRDWHKRFAQITDLLQTLPPAQLLHFVEEILFSEFSCSCLALETRAELLQNATKLCKKRLDSQEILPHLEHLARHLAAMMDPELDPLRSDLGLASLLRTLDLSCGQEDKLRELYVQCILDLLPLEILQTLLSVTASGSTLDDVHLDAIRHLEADLRLKEDSSESLISKLEEILKQIEAHSEELMVLPEMVWEILEPLCSDTLISPHARVAVLQLLREQLPALNPEDTAKVNSLWLSAAVESFWPHLGVSEVELLMENPEELFNQLLADATTEQQFRSLAGLLETTEQSQDSWLQLIRIALERKKVFAISSVVPAALPHITDPQTVYQLVLEHGGDAKSALQVALVTDAPDLWHAALEHAKDISLDPDTDLPLVRTLADHNLLSRPDAPLFQQSVNLIITCRDSALAASVASLLSHYGHSAEAASLLAISQELPSSLISFSSVLDSFHHWLN